MLIERLGKYNRTLDCGLKFFMPVIESPRPMWFRFTQGVAKGQVVTIDRLVSRIDLREQVFDFPKQSVITRDNVTMNINAVLYYQITDPVKSLYEIANLPNAIEVLTKTTLRNIVGEMDLDECLTSREKINDTMRTILDDATDKWGVRITRVELQDIEPPSDVRQAMEKQMRAERDKRATILEAEGRKQSAILTAEGQREAAIREAEGVKTAQILRAEGQAEARVKVAQAESEALAKIKGVLEDKTADYLIAVNYLETLPKVADGQSTKVFLPLETSGVLGSLGGIKELFKEIEGG